MWKEWLTGLSDSALEILVIAMGFASAWYFVVVH